VFAREYVCSNGGLHVHHQMHGGQTLASNVEHYDQAIEPDL